MTARTSTLWTFAITSVALFMVSLDNLVVTTAIPVIREDLGASLESLEWTVNAYTLTFAVLLLTGAALGDRFGRRRMFAIGVGDLHGRLRRRGARPDRRVAERRPCRAGPRWRDRHAADADHPQCRGAAREARAGARRLGRHRRTGRRVRARGRRRRRRRARLAVDLLAQRADRAAARPARTDPLAGDAPARAAGSTCPVSGSPAQACSGSSGASCAATARAGRAPRSSSRSGWARR